MSQIQQLIEKYCPDGVEWKALGDVCKIKNGKDYKNLGTGDIPVWGTGGIMCYVDKFAYNKPSVLLPRKGSIDKIYYTESPFWNVDTLFYTIINTSIILPKFLYYYLLTVNLVSLDTSKGNRPSLTQTVLNNIEIPLPSLEIQKRIVEDLDKLTGMIDNLEKELDLRRKQYENYREKLLSLDGEEDVEWKKVGEVCEIHGRIGWQGLTKKDYRTTGKYLLVTGTDFMSSNKINYNTCVYVDEDRYTQDKYIQLKENDLLITKDGTIGKLAIVQDLPMPATLNGGVFVIRDKTKTLDHRFLMYIMASSHFKNQIEKKHTNGTIKHLTQNLLVSYAIPVPPLEVQKRIVSILDKFTALIENIETELSLRQNQYEYYREQLLTF